MANKQVALPTTMSAAAQAYFFKRIVFIMFVTLVFELKAKAEEAWQALLYQAAFTKNDFRGKKISR